MHIKRMEIMDFFVFKDALAVDFCPGVNVFIGENGTGKTTLLRAIHLRAKNTMHYSHTNDALSYGYPPHTYIR